MPNLWDSLAEHHQTLTHVQWWPIFIKLGQKFGGPSPKIWLSITWKFSATRFRTTSRLDPSWSRLSPGRNNILSKIEQEAQIPQRNSASAAYVSLYRLANWSCNAQNTAESQRLYYFWHSNALIQEVLAENGFWHEIATQGHFRSFILQSFTGRQGVAYRRIGLILLAIYLSEVFEDVVT